MVVKSQKIVPIEDGVINREVDNIHKNIEDIQVFQIKKTDVNLLLTDDDSLIHCSKNGLTITLPSKTIPDGKKYLIKDISGDASSSNIIVATADAKKIDGADTAAISADFGIVRIYFSKTEGAWFTW